MKKLLLILIIVAVAAVGLIVYVVIGPHKSVVAPGTKTNAPATPAASSFKKACDVLTQSEADSVLGNGSVKGDASSTDVVTAERSVTTCTYTHGQVLDGNFSAATVLIRASASTEAKTSFQSAKMNDAQDVQDLGVPAYWSPTYGQLNVLSGDNWVILSVGGQTPGSRTLASTKQLAQLIIPRL